VNLLFDVIYFSERSILWGIPSDFVAMLLLFVYFVDYSIKRSMKGLLKIVGVSIACLFLNSFSSYLAIIAGMLIFFLETKKYVQFAMVAIVLSVGMLAGISYLENNIGNFLLLSKPAEAYLTGSGRFILYTTAYEIYLNEFSLLQQIFGVGFMAERSLLEGRDLFWITDPHNSLILNALGLGAVGILIYLSFVAYPMFASNKLDRSYKKHWIFFHFSSVVYGMTSSYYLGRPSFLLMFSLVLYQIVRSDNRQKFKTASASQSPSSTPPKRIECSPGMLGPEIALCDRDKQP
jgi:hypothetical protein